MRKNILLIAAMAFSLTVTGCIGAGPVSDITPPAGENMFPRLTGTNLNGNEIVAPHELSGDYKLLLIAFQREQQSEIDTWLSEVKDMEARYPAFRYYEIPLIYEAGMVTRLWANNGMRSGIQNETARQKTITVYTDRTQFFELMNMEKNSIYAVLVNNKNEIIWRAAGPATSEKLQDLKSRVGGKDDSTG
jgi:hypothetical protein